LRGMDRADLVLHLIDATEGVTEQDKRIASFIEDKGKACIIVINKWDLAKDNELDADVYAAKVREQLNFVDHAPIRFISAKTGKRVHDVLSTASELAKRHFLRVSTSQVNKVLLDAVAAHQPPIHKGKRVRLYFATQVKTAPPTFVVATNDTEGVHFSYRRYLINAMREAFDFGGAPVRIIFRRREGDRLKQLSPAQKKNRDLKRKSEGHQGTTAPRRKGEARNAPPSPTTARGGAKSRGKSTGTGRAGSKGRR
ncbi:MAG TPA: GTP-binding protein, partial [Myxococcota bacterium]